MSIITVDQLAAGISATRNYIDSEVSAANSLANTAYALADNAAAIASAANTYASALCLYGEYDSENESLTLSIAST